MKFGEFIYLCKDFLSDHFNLYLTPYQTRIRKVTDFLSKKWMIDILYALYESNRNFSTLKKELNISSQELSKKLRLLESYELIKKQSSFMNEREGNSYESTVTGHDLCNLIQNLDKFSKKYLKEEV